MSLISKALKKSEDSRQNFQKDNPNNIVYLTDVPQSWPRKVLLGFLVISTLSAILISLAAIIFTLKNSESKQNQVLGLEKTIDNQEKQINDFIAAVKKNQKLTDSQVRILNSNFKEQNNEIKIRISNLKLSENDHYSRLKDAILDDKAEIGLLDRYAKNLNQKIERISAAESQAKDLTIPSGGN